MRINGLLALGAALALGACVGEMPEGEDLTDGIDLGKADGPAPGSTPAPNTTVDCDVLVVGGGAGGVGATLGAARTGAKVCVTEETDWLGGQFTAQGLNASDENQYIEDVGSTKTFQKFRALIRAPYGGKANPGRCWVSYLCAPPIAAVDAIGTLLSPYIQQGKVKVFYGVTPASVDKSGDRVTAVRIRRVQDGGVFTVRAKQTIDATELGDVIKLAGAAYRTGQESRAETGEPEAPQAACSDCVQGFTYVAILERRPAGEKHVIAKPPGYGVDPWMKDYSHGTTAMFSDYGVWRYRRIVDGSLVGGNDLSIMNWSDGNDYYWGNIIDKSPGEVATHLERARNRALGYVYWLQTQADGTGYPNLKLRTDLLGTSNGLAKQPYIRESRRLKALTTVKVTDISDAHVSGSRARGFSDAAGIGYYHLIDLHRNAAQGSGNPTGHGLPFQLPLGAMIPEKTDGLMAGAKNIGTTHLSNGAIRMHPTEWATGEAAGTFAALCTFWGVQPRVAYADVAHVREFQLRMLDAGAPLYWMTDVKPTDSDWRAMQFVAAIGVMGGPESNTLAFRPDTTINRAQTAAALVAALGLPLKNPATATFSDVPKTFWAYQAIETLAAAGIVAGTGGGKFSPAAQVTFAQLRIMIGRAVGDATAAQAVPARANDGEAMPRRAVARALLVVVKQRLALP
jgi:hypothetical protein